ncbi:MAG: hypothetical protein J6K72_01210 [Clostridia bacterium]|jgi:K+-sensing histidine kinase KdpD|nr:hypothetical protein [Clostridia bacterium]
MAKPVLALVTLQRSCARLIRKGADLAMKQQSSLYVLHVIAQDAMGDQEKYAKTLDYLYALAGEVGAEMCMRIAEVPLTAIANYAQEIGAGQVVMGGGEKASGIAETLSGLLPGVQILIVDAEGAPV